MSNKTSNFENPLKLLQKKGNSNILMCFREETFEKFIDFFYQNIKLDFELETFQFIELINYLMINFNSIKLCFN